jgi:Rieske 2Fe-2S family protein
VDFLFHPDETARPGFDPRDAVDFWDLVNRQDWTVCERVQLGMQSRAFRFGYLAPMESLSGDIRTYLREKLGEFPDAD